MNTAKILLAIRQELAAMAQSPERDIKGRFLNEVAERLGYEHNKAENLFEPADQNSLIAKCSEILDWYADQSRFASYEELQGKRDLLACYMAEVNEHKSGAYSYFKTTETSRKILFFKLKADWMKPNAEGKGLSAAAAEIKAENDPKLVELRQKQATADGLQEHWLCYYFSLKNIADAMNERLKGMAGTEANEARISRAQSVDEPGSRETGQPNQLKINHLSFL
jgi:hypothetical protein